MQKDHLTVTSTALRRLGGNLESAARSGALVLRPAKQVYRPHGAQSDMAGWKRTRTSACAARMTCSPGVRRPGSSWEHSALWPGLPGWVCQSPLSHLAPIRPDHNSHANCQGLTALCNLRNKPPIPAHASLLLQNPQHPGSHTSLLLRAEEGLHGSHGAGSSPIEEEATLAPARHFLRAKLP